MNAVGVQRKIAQSVFGGINKAIMKSFCNGCKHWEYIQACENEWTCIFKTLVDSKTFGSYCFIDCTGWFCKTVSKTFKEVFTNNGEIHPASKEQRDQLEKAMFDAGYEWDAEKKELKKIEDDPENYKKKERTSESTIYEDDIHYSNDCADCTRDSCEDCYPY